MGISAAALWFSLSQGLYAHSTNIEVLEVRPSWLIEYSGKAVGDIRKQSKLGGIVLADDAAGRLIVVGDPDFTRTVSKMASLLDHRPTELEVKIDFESKLDHHQAEWNLKTVNQGKMTVVDHYTQLSLSFRPVINGDWTVTLNISATRNGRTWTTVPRVKIGAPTSFSPEPAITSPSTKADFRKPSAFEGMSFTIQAKLVQSPAPAKSKSK